MEDSSMSEVATRELVRAQRILDRVQKKIQTYKKDQKTISQTKVNPPDIQKYLTYLIQQQQYHNHNPNQSIHHSKPNHQYDYPLNSSQSSKKIYQHTEQLLSQINPMHFNIERLQSLYEQKNQRLSDKIQELNFQGQKIQKDKKLLLMQNEELQQKIKRLKHNNKVSEKILQIQSQIESIKTQNQKVGRQNQKLIKKNRQIEEQLKQDIDIYKSIVRSDLPKTKSKSMLTEKRCPYH